MALGAIVEYILTTVNTDGEEIILSDIVYDPKQLLELAGNHKDETIIRQIGEERVPYMKWNTERYEWQFIN